MRRIATCLVLAAALSARGVCVERAFIPNVPAVTAFIDPVLQQFTTVGVAGDFNGDGITDVAVAGEAILYGTPSGRMIPRPLNSSIVPVYAVAADLNGDGKLDLVAADLAYITIRLSQGDGTFGAERVIIHTSGYQFITGLAAGDFNGDGRTDLLISDRMGLKTYIGHGDGTFMPGATMPIAANRHEMAVGDFDRDGRLDVAAVSGDDSQLVVARGNGDGTFTVIQQVTFPFDPTLELRVVAADFDGDGVVDLAVASSEGLRIMHGAGDGTFRAGPLVPLDWVKTWGAPRHLVVADFNHDGLPDLVAVQGYAIARFTNLGGHFGVPAIAQFVGENIGFEVKSDPVDVFAADLDGDGWLDIIELDALAFVGVLFNSCAESMILRTSADAVLSGVPFRLALYDASGAVTAQTTFRDGGTVLGSGAGSLTTSLLTAGRHSLTATTAAGTTAALALTVYNQPSSITFNDSKDHSLYGEGIHLSGSVATDTGEAPSFGNVEIVQGMTIVATAPLINGRYDLVFNPLPSTYKLFARYTGAGRWVHSDPSAPLVHVVTVAPTTMTIVGLTAGSVCEHKSSPRFNGTWGFAVIVAAAFGTPTGTVTVSFPKLHTDTEALFKGGVGFYYGAVHPGTYAFTATYSGDAGHPSNQIAGTITIPDCHQRATAHR